MTDTMHSLDAMRSLDERVCLFAERIDRLRVEMTRSAVGKLVEETRELFALEKRVEAQHITRGLDEPDFPFAAAQSELRRSRLELARLVRDLARAAGELLSPDERKEAEEVSFLCERAPLADESDLAAIRRAREWREARKRVKS